MDDKFILMDMNDERTKKVAEVMGNATCKKIIEFLAETKEASEKDISDALGIPLNTAEYNLKKLIESGLVEKTKNFFWSTKGKKIEMFKLANKHIVISPKPKKRPDMKALKTILPIIIIALAALLVVMFMFPGSKEIFVGTNVSILANESQLKHFSSYDELKNFINESYSGRDYGYYGGAEMMMDKVTAGAAPTAAVAESVGGAEEFSTTNIQVEGVDEPDIIKNDGKYIYAVSGNKVVIVNAYPAENMGILSEIDLNKSVSEIFINGNKLIIFAQGYEYVPYTESKCLGYGYKEYGSGCGGDYNYRSLVYIYDVKNRENPKLEQNISVEGSYFDSRMIGDYVYVVSTKYINRENPQPPIYEVNGVETKIAAEDVYYWPHYDTSYVFTSISAINIEDGETDGKVFLTGHTGTIYVSQDNIYLTYQKRMDYKERFKRQAEEVYLPLLPDEEKEEIEEIMKENKNKLNYEVRQEISGIVEKYSEDLIGNEKANFDSRLLKALEDFEVKIEKENEQTIIHKIKVKKDKISYEGQGEAPGYILNQFSMDEYEGNFRIATTTGGSWRATSLNHLYILGEDLEIIGSVEDLAKGERIYSVRFLGKRAYVVTFKQVDPLFVIDVENPKKPEVLGYLKITGFSDYLHFYDENHIIGIGKEATEQGRFLGLKISLFDVSDVENPVEKAKIEIGDRGTSSPALYDHKAFLFDKQKNLLVIPIQLYEINEEKPSDWSYGEYVWQGAYVLNINTEKISVRGKITHVEEYKPKYGPAEDDDIGVTRDINGQTWTKTGANKWKTSPVDYHYGYDYDWSWTDEMIDQQEGGVNYKQYIYDWKFQIQRSLYMDNVLYTISNSKVKANNLETIDEISSVKLPYEETSYPYWGWA